MLGIVPAVCMRYMKWIYKGQSTHLHNCVLQACSLVTVRSKGVLYARFAAQANMQHVHQGSCMRRGWWFMNSWCQHLQPRPGSNLRLKLVCAHAGDCRAVLVRGGRAEQVTRAHTADDPQERQRIQASHPDAVRRIGTGWRVGPVALQVSR